MRITVSEAATLTGKSVETIRHWLRKRWIKSAEKSGPRIWLMDQQEVTNFLPPKRGWPAGKKRR